MSFNYQFDNNSYQGRSYQRQYNKPVGRGYRQAPMNAYQPTPKKSGCRITEGKNGKPCVTAWKASKHGFLTLVACPNNGDKLMRQDGSVIVNKKGQEYARWTAKLVDKHSGSVSSHQALYNLATGKLYLPDLKMVASPKAPNGGFFGNSYVSKRR